MQQKKKHKFRKHLIDTNESSYVVLLEKTKGSWKDEKWEELKKNRSLIELEASKLRKKL